MEVDNIFTVKAKKRICDFCTNTKDKAETCSNCGKDYCTHCGIMNYYHDNDFCKGCYKKYTKFLKQLDPFKNQYKEDFIKLYKEVMKPSVNCEDSIILRVFEEPMELPEDNYDYD